MLQIHKAAEPDSNTVIPFFLKNIRKVRQRSGLRSGAGAGFDSNQNLHHWTNKALCSGWISGRPGCHCHGNTSKGTIKLFSIYLKIAIHHKKNNIVVFAEFEEEKREIQETIMEMREIYTEIEK